MSDPLGLDSNLFLSDSLRKTLKMIYEASRERANSSMTDEVVFFMAIDYLKDSIKAMEDELSTKELFDYVTGPDIETKKIPWVGFVSNDQTAPTVLEFEGTVTGDGECFCWEVSRETCIAINGENKTEQRETFKIECDWNEDEDECISAKSEEVYRLYPNDVMSYFHIEQDDKVRVKIVVEKSV